MNGILRLPPPQTKEEAAAREDALLRACETEVRKGNARWEDRHIQMGMKW